MRLNLDGLAAASREALVAEWREVVGRPPPKHLSKPLMAQILSHAYQVDTVGGYTKRLDSRLKLMAEEVGFYLLPIFTHVLLIHLGILHFIWVPFWVPKWVHNS